MSELPHQAYDYGWICDLPLEMTAAAGMFDEYHNAMCMDTLDGKIEYRLGGIGEYNTVVVRLVDRADPSERVRVLLKSLVESFPNIQSVLLVTVGSGAPSPRNDIRLGDVVVGTWGKAPGGILAHSLQEQSPSVSLSPCSMKSPDELQYAMSKLEVQHMMHGNQILTTIEGMIASHPELQDKGYGYDESRIDELYDETDERPNPDRPVRPDPAPEVHYGLIASGPLEKKAAVRNQLAAQYNILAFDNMAAFLTDDLPCLVVVGVCDYADGHSDDSWQTYAAVTAAGYVKELVLALPEKEKPEDVQRSYLYPIPFLTLEHWQSNTVRFVLDQQ